MTRQKISLVKDNQIRYDNRLIYDLLFSSEKDAKSYH